MSGETFEALLAPNLHFVRTLVHTRLRNFGCADDVVQRILLRAFLCRNQLRVQDKFKEWLWSIAMNEIRTFFRRNRNVVSLDAFPTLDILDHAMSPLARLERRELCNRVRNCIAELPERDKTVILLRDFYDKSLSETAGMLDTSLSATKSAHFRARKRLARMIGREAARRPGAAHSAGSVRPRAGLAWSGSVLKAAGRAAESVQRLFQNPADCP